MWIDCFGGKKLLQKCNGNEFPCGAISELRHKIELGNNLGYNGSHYGNLGHYGNQDLKRILSFSPSPRYLRIRCVFALTCNSANQK